MFSKQAHRNVKKSNQNAKQRDYVSGRPNTKQERLPLQHKGELKKVKLFL
jgi:hypothetical protein